MITPMAESIDLRRFVAESPLYSRLELPVAYAPQAVPASTAEQALKQSNERPPLAISLLIPKFSVDALCISCKGPSIFTPVVPAKAEEDMQKFLAAGGLLHHVLPFTCSRDASHELIAILRVIARWIDPRIETHHRRVFIWKIGMWPSLADLRKPVNDRYLKVIGVSAVAELNRGIGLAAHGVGIGAFVYLRRIFEDVIDEVAKAAIGAGEVKEEDYKRLRTDEKIALLDSRLPRSSSRTRIGTAS